VRFRYGSAVKEASFTWVSLRTREFGYLGFIGVGERLNERNLGAILEKTNKRLAPGSERWII